MNGLYLIEIGLLTSGGVLFGAMNAPLSLGKESLSYTSRDMLNLDIADSNYLPVCGELGTTYFLLEDRDFASIP